MNTNKNLKFVKKMKVKCFDLDAGKPISIMHENAVKELGIQPLERVEITNPLTGNKTVTVVDVTNTMLQEDEIGIFISSGKSLKCDTGQEVDVRVVSRPLTVKYIKKKINGEKLSQDEIKAIVEDIASNTLSEIEASAFMTSVYINGFDLDEIVYMTKALIQDGKTLEFSRPDVLDKHSIGGVNGRVTMLIVPIIAAAGCLIPKTSSRAITSCAGTADAMEVLANVNLSIDEIKKITEKVGGVITWGGAVELAPADDKIIKIEYPLSLDPEGQVIASVMAKKSSVGAKYVVIDIPVGPDVKIKTREKAEEIAHKFVEVGKRLGIEAEVVITNGTEPSGKAFGAGLEAKYVMEILEGKFFDNLAQKSCELAGALFDLSGKCREGQGYSKAKEILKSGKALQKMHEIIKAQGGKITKSEEIKLGKFKAIITAKEEGEISKINVKHLLFIARLSGSPVDKRAGVMLLVNEGEKVKKHQPLFEIYAENERKISLAKEFAETTEIIELEKIILEKFK